MANVLDEVVATAQVRRGRLFIQHRHVFDQQVKLLDERWMLEVTVKRLCATRSQQANRYWWGVCLALASEKTGYTPEELHEIAKQMFIPKKLAIYDGNGVVVGDYVMGGSTRTMNTADFALFVERFKQWCAEKLDLYIPDADVPMSTPTPLVQAAAISVVADERGEAPAGHDGGDRAQLPPGARLIHRVNPGPHGSECEIEFIDGAIFLSWNRHLKAQAEEWARDRVPVFPEFKISGSRNTYIEHLVPVALPGQAF